MLRNKRKAFYYDAETCTYKPAVSSPRHIIVRLFVYFSFSLAVCAATFLIYKDRVEAKKQVIHATQLARVDSLFTLHNSHLDQLEENLERIFSRSNGLYSPLVQSERISPSIWFGGTGGAARKVTDQYKLLDRLENLRYKAKELTLALSKASKKAEQKPEELRHIPSILPVKGSLRSGFGYRTHPIRGGRHLHTGLDFSAPTGTPIYASADGVVKFSGGNGNGYGRHVDIDHGNGFVTKYAHMSKLLVEEGQQVKRGDKIGLVGSTGLSTAPHLHYEIILKGVKIDPIDYFYTDLLPAEYLTLLKNSKDLIKEVHPSEITEASFD